jgi:drug/metabolite transporter (DMT)-like permease
LNGRTVVSFAWWVLRRPLRRSDQHVRTLDGTPRCTGDPGERMHPLTAAAAAPPGPTEAASIATHRNPATFNSAVAYGLVVILALVWGVHWVVAKTGLSYLPPFTYGVLRVAIAAGALAVVLGVQGRIKLPSRRDVPVVLAGGLGQIAAAIILMNIALQSLPAGRSALLAYTTPLWVVVLQVLVLRARPSSREIGALGFGLFGIAILLNPTAIDWHSSGALAGSGMMLLSAVIMGATILQLRHHHWDGSTLDLMFWELVVALVPLGLLALIFESGEPIHWQAQAVFCVLYSGLLGTAFAYWASQSIQRTLAPLASALCFLAVPVVGIVAGAVLLGEEIGLVDLAGFAATFVGIGLLSLYGLGRRQTRAN